MVRVVPKKQAAERKKKRKEKKWAAEENGKGERIPGVTKIKEQRGNNSWGIKKKEEKWVVKKTVYNSVNKLLGL